MPVPRTFPFAHIANEDVGGTGYCNSLYIDIQYKA
ncbi:hypothetical protein U14_04445 [Candidatus Moduliflexus flocculans]|uniref:Uncharacterized protein n=1 Tax=Candidatus Moduliflexus flocculans TaxID=1499966 RepID=A0A0S6W4S0_9BACT|nr:hypothetical protein U14_04445 [Candidatus Moduliflexus flocculans]